MVPAIKFPSLTRSYYSVTEGHSKNVYPFPHSPGRYRYVALFFIRLTMEPFTEQHFGRKGTTQPWRYKLNLR